MNHSYENDFGYVRDCPYNLHLIEDSWWPTIGDLAVKRALQTLAANEIPHELLFPIERYWKGHMNLVELALLAQSQAELQSGGNESYERR